MNIATAVRTHRDANAVESPAPAISKSVADYCGCCTGFRTIWCPDCCGYDGCTTCHHTRRVRCPACNGGTMDPIQW